MNKRDIKIQTNTINLRRLEIKRTQKKTFFNTKKTQREQQRENITDKKLVQIVHGFYANQWLLQSLV